MCRSTLVMILLSLALAGCVSSKNADLRERAAYLAGQQQSSRQGPTDRPPGVSVRGPVRSPNVPWEENLTLAKAIVTADYTGFMNPVIIRVIRNGRVAEEMKGIDLLHGKDVPLDPGDIVDIVP